MGVPVTLADLDPIAANNSPSGSDPIGTNLDDYLRAHAALIKQTSFASGTRMPFAQAAAPTGWTQDVTDTATNRMLRVVNTTGGGIAGTHSPILNNVVPTHTHSLSVNAVNIDHTHSGWTDYQGLHTHGGTLRRNGISLDNGTSGGGNDVSTTDAAGSHNHNVGTSGMSANALHSHSGTTDGGSSATNWAPRYIDMIICAKD